MRLKTYFLPHISQVGGRLTGFFLVKYLTNHLFYNKLEGILPIIFAVKDVEYQLLLSQLIMIISCQCINFSLIWRRCHYR